MLNRRQFLGTLIGGIAATAAVRTFPFRVYSFPTEFVRPDFQSLIVPGSLDELNRVTMEMLTPQVLYDNFFVEEPFLAALRSKQPIKFKPLDIQTPFTFDRRPES